MRMFHEHRSSLLLVEMLLSKEQVIGPLSISFKLHCQHFQHCSKPRRNLAFTEHCLYPCPRDLTEATISFMIVRRHTYIVCPCCEAELDYPNSSCKLAYEVCYKLCQNGNVFWIFMPFLSVRILKPL